MEPVYSLTELLKAIQTEHGLFVKDYTLRRVLDRLEREGKIPLQRVKGCRVIGQKDIPEIVAELKA